MWWERGEWFLRKWTEELPPITVPKKRNFLCLRGPSQENLGELSGPEKGPWG